MRNRLSTRDKLLTWGYQGDAQCVFCRNGLESRDHLFFKCNFSSRIQIACLQRCNVMAPPLVWQVLINEGCRNWILKTMMDVLCRLVLSSIVYGIWRARNEIKHHGQPKTEEQTLKLIFWEV